MGRRGLLIMVMLLAACSSSHKAPTPPTTTASTTTTIESTTSTSTTTITTTTTTTTVATARVRIEGFAATPPSPIPCNAPTSVELRWMAIGATAVDLAIDGQRFATFAGGTQDHLEPFACDGKAHSFVLTTRPAGATARLVITSTG